MDITCVWKLNGLGAAGDVGTPSPISSSAAMTEGGARRLSRGILRAEDSVNEVGAVSSITKVGGGVAVDSGRERRTGSICFDALSLILRNSKENFNHECSLVHTSQLKRQKNPASEAIAI